MVVAGVVLEPGDVLGLVEHDQLWIARTGFRSAEGSCYPRSVVYGLEQCKRGLRRNHGRSGGKVGVGHRLDAVGDDGALAPSFGEHAHSKSAQGIGCAGLAKGTPRWVGLQPSLV